MGEGGLVTRPLQAQAPTCIFPTVFSSGELDMLPSEATVSAEQSRLILTLGTSRLCMVCGSKEMNQLP